MANLQQPPTDLAIVPIVLADSASWSAADDDFPLGCECADPTLQIERWSQEMLTSGAESH